MSAAPIRALADDLIASIASGASIIDRATVWPWVVHVIWQREGEAIGQHALQIVQRSMFDPPVEFDAGVPDGAVVLRSEIYPCTRFDDMTPTVRRVHTNHYREYLMWRRAHALGKKREQLDPWKDYDPIMIDESVQRWLQPGVRFAGD